MGKNDKPEDKSEKGAAEKGPEDFKTLTDHDAYRMGDEEGDMPDRSPTLPLSDEINAVIEDTNDGQDPRATIVPAEEKKEDPKIGPPQLTDELGGLLDDEHEDAPTVEITKEENPPPPDLKLKPKPGPSSRRFPKWVIAGGTVAIGAVITIGGISRVMSQNDPSTDSTDLTVTTMELKPTNPEETAEQIEPKLVVPEEFGPYLDLITEAKKDKDTETGLFIYMCDDGVILDTKNADDGVFLWLDEKYKGSTWVAGKEWEQAEGFKEFEPIPLETCKIPEYNGKLVIEVLELEN